MKQPIRLVLSLMSASLTALPAAAAPQARAVVEAVLSRSPHLEALRREASSGRSAARAAAVWDGPRLSLARGRHDSPEGRGRVLELGLSQRLPLWGRRAGESRSLDARAEAAEWSARAEALDLEHGTWLDLYGLASFGKLKEHLAERRQRLGLVRTHLANRSFLSPAMAADKGLVELRLRDLESEFDRVESEESALMRKVELLSGLKLDAPPLVDWLETLPRLSTAAADPQSLPVRRAESQAKAAEASLAAARRARYPEPEIGVSGSRESGGSGEKTSSAELGLEIPLSAWSGRPGAAASEALSAARARAEDAKLDAALEQTRWRAALEERVRRVARYPLSLAAELDGQIDKTELDLRKGLVPVLTFLELEGRAHEQVESAYRAQTDYLEAVSRLRRLRGRGFAADEEAP